MIEYEKCYQYSYDEGQTWFYCIWSPLAAKSDRGAKKWKEGLAAGKSRPIYKDIHVRRRRVTIGEWSEV